MFFVFQLALIGADEGLYVMTLKAHVRSRPLLQVSGVTCVHQMLLVEKLDVIIFITGESTYTVDLIDCPIHAVHAELD